jgi:putative transposase
VLRHQVRLLQRQRPRRPRLSHGKKLTLAVLAAALVRLTAGSRDQLSQYFLVFKPDTILSWHRELVRRKWTYRRTNPGGRPRIPGEVDVLVLRLARENPCWGHRRIQGELAKLGHAVSASTVRAALRRHRVPPLPERGRAITWRDFLPSFGQGSTFVHRSTATITEHGGRATSGGTIRSPRRALMQ